MAEGFSADWGAQPNASEAWGADKAAAAPAAQPGQPAAAVPEGFDTSAFEAAGADLAPAATEATNGATPEEEEGGDDTFVPIVKGALRDEPATVEVTGSTDHVSAKEWADLNLAKALMNAIYEVGFTRPSKIQEVALPIIAKGRNLIGQAHNGTGKTAAYSIGVLSRIDPKNRLPQAVILAHTRELAHQVAGVVSDLGKYLGVVISLIVPKQEWQGTGHVLVGTPGKTLEYLKKRWVTVAEVKVFVLDEADVMLNQDNQMGPQVNMVRRFLPNDLQTLLFSATFPDQVRSFASQIIKNAAKIIVRKEELTVSNVIQMYHRCDSWEAKYKKLSELYTYLSMIGQSIIFVNSRDDAFKLATQLKSDGHAVSKICGSRSGAEAQLDPQVRDQIMSEFRAGETKVLVATDVLSRGIDVPAVTLVVNFQLPLMFEEGRPRGDQRTDMESYLHRVGRTGRFGSPGIAINLVNPKESNQLDEVRDYFECEITQMPRDEELEQQVRKLR